MPCCRFRNTTTTLQVFRVSTANEFHSAEHVGGGNFQESLGRRFIFSALRNPLWFEVWLWHWGDSKMNCSLSSAEHILLLWINHDYNFSLVVCWQCSDFLPERLFRFRFGDVPGFLFIVHVIIAFKFTFHDHTKLFICQMSDDYCHKAFIHCERSCIDHEEYHLWWSFINPTYSHDVCHPERHFFFTVMSCHKIFALIFFETWFIRRWTYSESKGEQNPRSFHFHDVFGQSLAGWTPMDINHIVCRTRFRTLQI